MSVARTLGAALCVLAAGCASTPPARFYTLEASAPAAGTSTEIAVSVGPVSIPALVDRPQMVLGDGMKPVRLDELHRWAMPLQENLSSVIAQNLGALLGTPRVTRFPKSSASQADFRVAVDVERFESVAQQWVRLDAVWTVRQMSDGATEQHRSSVREPVNGAGYDELVAAHSRAAARLSQGIAEAVLRFPAHEIVRR
jgi:uncharacterized lipoprotein YmbA